MLSNEIWKPIKKYEGLYEISLYINGCGLWLVMKKENSYEKF